MTDNIFKFKQAKPVWLDGLCNEPNTTAVFVYRVKEANPANLTLYITGYTSYRVKADGKMLCYGPARTAIYYARVDEDAIPEGTKELVIKVAGYRCYSLSSVNQPSYLCAEIRDEKGNIVAHTAGGEDGGFILHSFPERIQKVMRYSRQRQFSEVMDFRCGVHDYSAKNRAKAEELDLPITFIQRGVPYPDYGEIEIGACESMGSYTYDESATIKNAPYSDKDMMSYSERDKAVTDGWGGWKYDDIEYFPFRYIQRCKICAEQENVKLPITLKAGEYARFDFEAVEAGFIGADFIASEMSDIIIGYNEYCLPKTYVIPRMTAVNVLEYRLGAGEEYSDYSAEPYTAKTLIVIVKEGEITLRGIGMKRYRNPVANDCHRPEIKDETLNMIYDACVRSYAHNAVDLYTDCPSRECSGWLCDSYFTSQTEYYLTGKTEIERAFLENYALCSKMEAPYGRVMPDGLIPMCYPAAIPGSLYIPQWAMWFVLELDMYLNERNREADREIFREKVLNLAKFFEKHENADGLLEKLPGWQFIEWSQANKWGQDISYPTNFLYAEMLDCITRIYDIPSYAEKAKKVRKTTSEKSFNGRYFTDNAIYDENGVPHNTGNISEACQYYAIRFGKIDLCDPKYGVLANAVENIFEMGQVPVTDIPEEKIEPADALMGIYLRMEILFSMGESQRARLLKEIGNYFGERAAKTGTLWEYREAKGSLDHGFASFTGVIIGKSVEA